MTDWDALSTAGAFIIGVIVGGAAVARVSRNTMSYLRAERRDDPPETG